MILKVFYIIHINLRILRQEEAPVVVCKKLDSCPVLVVPMGEFARGALRAEHTRSSRGLY